MTYFWVYAIGVILNVVIWASISDDEELADILAVATISALWPVVIPVAIAWTVGRKLKVRMDERKRINSDPKLKFKDHLDRIIK